MSQISLFEVSGELISPKPQANSSSTQTQSKPLITQVASPKAKKSVVQPKAAAVSNSTSAFFQRCECGGLVIVPGLDASRCDRCGWRLNRHQQASQVRVGGLL